MRAFLMLPVFLVACGSSAQENAYPTPDAAGIVKDSTSSTDTATTAKDSASAEDTVVTDTAIAEDTATSVDTASDDSTDMCGGIAGKVCSGGYYCYMAAGRCSIPDAAGTCAPIPTGCSKELNPVCGCDGKNYSNPCMAAAAGVNVASSGNCGTPTGCGGGCTKAEYCEFAAAGVCTGDGMCRARPEVCPGIYDPVCGCNGVTYSNSCAAHQSGVDFASMGECP